MSKFQDAAQREWKLELDGLLIADLRDQHKIDLADLAGETWLRLERDPSLLTVALCFLLAEQLPPGMTKRHLAAQLRGEVLVPALDALAEAARLFFPARHWSALTSALAQQKEAAATWDRLRPMMAILKQPDMPEAMKQAVLSALTSMMQQMKPGDSEKFAESLFASGPEDTPPTSASPSPATSESTPAA